MTALPRLWPYPDVRPEQDKLVTAVQSTLATKQSLVVHAPTGLGKTVATLVPALETALEKDAVVLFLSGRHTQHAIAIETAKDIKDKHNLDFGVVNIVGKKWLCLQPGVEGLKSRQFAEYCKAMKAEKQCAYFENLKKGEELTANARQALKGLKGVSPLTTLEVKAAGKRCALCPYELSLLLAKDAKLIITDYLYLFDPGIRELFLARIGKTLEQCILVVDEAHNLPERVKELASDRLSTILLSRAIAEAEKYKHDELKEKLLRIGKVLEKLALFTDERGTIVDSEAEKYVGRDQFLNELERQDIQAEALQEWLAKVGDTIREEQRASFIGAIADFLTTWLQEEGGHTRILKRERGSQGWIINLNYRCLDPSVITHDVFENAYASVLMSGTLTPPRMYAGLLGVSEPNLLMLESPFPEENKLNLIIPKTSTKFTQRSDKMWQEITDILRNVVLAVPGNVAVYFPSYAILKQVLGRLDQGLPKTVLAEQRGMSKEEKHTFLNTFKGYSKQGGAVLLAVITGNYGEGIDLPGDLLKGVVVVGLPLSKPDLEAKALIDYYDAKFRKGWEYGYIIPAFNKTLQSAGRCIRSSTDKGVIVFLDERYEWPRYASLFPKEWRIKSTLLYEKMIKEFFEKNGNLKKAQNMLPNTPVNR